MTAREAARSPVAVLPVLNRRNLIAGGLSLSFVVFLATSFDFDASEALARVRGEGAPLLVLAFAAHYASLIVRGHRWRLMLTSALGTAPSTLTCSLYLLLCWFVNAVTWLRLGNVYRAYLVAEDGRGRLAGALGTVLSERFLDLLAVLLMLAVAGVLLLSSGDGSRVAPFMAVAGAAVVLFAVGLLVLRRLPATLSRRLPERLAEHLDGFRYAAVASLSRRDLPLTGALTLVAWGLEALRLWLVVLALGLEISPEMLFFVTFAQAMLLSIPLTPGGLGVVEPGLLGLLLFSFDRPDAAAITLLDRAISFVSVVLIGAVAFGLREALVRRRSAAVMDEAAGTAG